ncbi:MAG: hypothetical protein WED11_06750, partial [Natronospirillum sp.]
SGSFMSRTRREAIIPPLPTALANSALWQKRTWLSYWLAMALFAINTAANAPSGLAPAPLITAGMTFWLLQTILLWLFLPALKKRLPRRLSWFGYVLLLYLPFCIVGALQPPYWSGVLISVAIVLLFLNNAYWVRALKQLHAAKAKADS